MDAAQEAYDRLVRDRRELTPEQREEWAKETARRAQDHRIRNRLPKAV